MPRPAPPRSTRRRVAAVLTSSVLTALVLLVVAPWSPAASAEDGPGTTDPSPTVTLPPTTTTPPSTSTSSEATTTTVPSETTRPAPPTSARAATTTTPTTVAGHTDAQGAVADPAILWADDQAVVFSTQRVTNGVATTNIPMRTSTDLFHWTDAGDALPVLPPWATIGGTWAPSAVQMADGSYRLYFAARSTAGPECIGVAVSTSSLGPYTSTSSRPLVCQMTMGGSIDPSVYVDPAGSPWLTWKNDGNAAGRAVWLWSSRLAPDGLSLVGPASALLTTSAAWQAGVVENPDLVTIDGVLYLFYSGGAWSDASYGTGFATCAGPAGPCTNRTSGGPLQPDVGAVGDGSLSTFPLVDGRTGIAWSGWPYGDAAQGGSRTLFIGHIRLGPFGPELVAGLSSDPAPAAPTTAAPATTVTTSARSIDPATTGAARVQPARPHPAVRPAGGPSLLARIMGLLLIVVAVLAVVQVQRRRAPRSVAPVAPGLDAG